MKKPITIETRPNIVARDVIGLQETPNGQVEITIGSTVDKQRTIITISADQRSKISEFFRP